MTQDTVVGTSDLDVNSSISRPSGEAPLARPLLLANDLTLSYCESTGGDELSYSGYRDLTPYPLASVSKVFLSAWALQQLGPDYRFKMIWKIKKISSEGAYDAYLQTNYDPIVNIEKILNSLSVLNKLGVRRIRNLVIDETTRVYLSVLSNPHIEISDIPVSTNQTLENLSKILNSTNWSEQTEIAKKNVSHLAIPSEFSVQNVTFQKRSQISQSYYNQEVQISSALLLKYLKEINVNSNNYVSDALFTFLGGEKAFENFQRNQLQISKQQLRLFTGSGLSTEVDGQRIDNVGSCLSILKTLKYLDLVTQRHNVNLGHVLLTAGVDRGTYESDLVFNRNVVLKTGRLFDVPTLNLAGINATARGNTYFAVMAHDFLNENEKQVKVQRDQLIADLLGYQTQVNAFQNLQMNTLFF
jgi:D-alanyl-D-alanine carboxypeptidase/D-alanyl-D-alanine-endopeptidase (penicillin-binding protein 4)